MKTFKTKKGTELPLLDLRGKEYLQVAHRLVWFREEHPDWGIQTEFVEKSPTHAIVKSTITNEKGFIMSTAHKAETKQGFADFHEKAETGAIGRALAACGYGTQFAPDLDEGERIVDAPVKRMSGPIAGTNATGGVLTQKQLARLHAIAKEAGWDKPTVLDYLGKLGLTSTSELNFMQYDHMCKAMEKFPRVTNKTEKEMATHV